MDEPSSGLDAASVELVFDRLIEGKTATVIAHRFLTIRAHNIFVIEDELRRGERHARATASVGWLLRQAVRSPVSRGGLISGNAALINDRQRADDVGFNIRPRLFDRCFLKPPSAPRTRRPADSTRIAKAAGLLTKMQDK
jgi:hypothetical protein